MFLSSMTPLFYLLLSIYFQVLGSIPLFIGGLIHSPVTPFEDSHTSFETSLVVARVLRSALILGFSFAFVVVGSSGLAKLTIDVLLLLAILNLLILREEFVKYLPEIKRVLSILAALLVVVASVLYVLVG